MILKGNLIWAPAPDRLEVREHAYLVASGETIVGLYRQLPPELAGQPVEDWGESILIPGFNDLHLHAPQYFNRGMGYDVRLLDWLNLYTFPLETRFQDTAFAEAAWKHVLNRLWAAGTLRFSAFATVHKEAAWRLMELTEASGLRGLVGKVNMDRNCPDELLEDTRASLADTEELICRSREELRHVGFILTPRFVPSTTEALMDGLGQLGEKYELPVQSHLSENPSEVDWVRELHPQIPTYTQVYETFGLLPRDRTIMAHGIYLSRAERELLRERGVTLAHCPLSNINLSSGVMPLRQDLEEGLRCCVASDVAGGHTPAMSRSITAAVGLSKLRWLASPEQRPLSLWESFYLATRGSGSFFGQVGCFEPGFQMDALVLPPDEEDGLLGRTPLERLERFLYDGDDRHIAARYCGGIRLERPFAR